MVRVRLCILSLFAVVLLLLVGDALSQCSMSCAGDGCEGNDDTSAGNEPAPEPSDGGGGGGRRPRRERYSYQDSLASSSSNTAAASIPQRPTRSRPTPSTSGQVITSSGWTEIESGGNAENESEEYTESSDEPEEDATASANEDAIQFTLPDGQVVETTLVGLVYEKGFQAGYKAEYMEGHNDASTGADPRGPLEIDFCECDTVAEEAQGIAELDELFLPDGDSTFSVANSLQASEEDVDAAVRTSFGKGVEEGLKADQTAYVQGYADGGAGVAPQNPPFHGETFTYLS